MDEKKGCIYKIVSPSGKTYIGQTACLWERKQHYKRLDCKNQILLYRSLVKYGFDAHVIEILENPLLTEIMEREKFWVEFFKSNVSKYPNNNGLNLTDGGIGVRGRKMSDEQKEKMSIRNKGKVLSKETRAKIGIASTQMWIRKRGPKPPEKPKGERLCIKGVPNYRTRRCILQCDKLTGETIKEYEYASLAALELGDINKISNIINTCKNNIKSAYGYSWKYKEG